MPKSKPIPEPEDESPFYLRSDENADEPKADQDADLSNFLNQDDNAPEPPGAPGNEAEPEPQPVRSFDWVVKITSLDLAELLDYPKGTDEFDVAYRRVPTSIGPVPAHVGNYLAKSESGIHVLRTDPRGSGHEPASDDL